MHNGSQALEKADRLTQHIDSQTYIIWFAAAVAAVVTVAFSGSTVCYNQTSGSFCFMLLCTHSPFECGEGEREREKERLILHCEIIISFRAFFFLFFNILNVDLTFLNAAPKINAHTNTCRTTNNQTNAPRKRENGR